MLVDPVTADIVGRRSPAVANGLITWRYHELARAMAERLDGLATWCAFGTWASRTAGASIRGEWLDAHATPEVDTGNPAVVRANARVPFADVVDEPVLARFLADVRVRVADMVWCGNRLVFEELGPAFTDFCEMFPAGTTPDQAAIATFLDRHRARQRDTGLTRALDLYCAALIETDRRRRVQLVCLANLEAVRHEQVRLDGFIGRALDAPVDELIHDLRPFVYAGRPGWQRLLLGALLWWSLAPLRDLASSMLAEATTRHMMTIRIAERAALALGRDIPPVVVGQPFRPVELDPPRIDGLEVFVERPGSDGTGSATQDWSLLEDRMDFISALFCSRLLLRDLLHPPFTPDQVAELRRDRVPPGLP